MKNRFIRTFQGLWINIDYITMVYVSAVDHTEKEFAIHIIMEDSSYHELGDRFQTEFLAQEWLDSFMKQLNDH